MTVMLHGNSDTLFFDVVTQFKRGNAVQLSPTFGGLPYSAILVPHPARSGWWLCVHLRRTVYVSLNATGADIDMLFEQPSEAAAVTKLVDGINQCWRERRGEAVEVAWNPQEPDAADPDRVRLHLRLDE